MMGCKPSGIPLGFHLLHRTPCIANAEGLKGTSEIGGGGQTKEKKPLCTKRWKKDWSRQKRGKMKQKRESLLEKNIGERARKAEIKTAEKKGASLASERFGISLQQLKYGLQMHLHYVP